MRQAMIEYAFRGLLRVALPLGFALGAWVVVVMS